MGPNDQLAMAKSMTAQSVRAPALFLMLLCCVAPAGAHAVLLKSTPPANAVVTEPATLVSLTFNTRIDGQRSRLTLVGPDGSEQPAELGAQQSPDTLTTRVAALKSGVYRLRWQVLAVDGHITRGEISFRVRLR